MFLIAYITKLAFYFAQVSTDNMFSNFYGCIFISSIQLVWNILPVFYSLYQHHRVFKAVVDKNFKGSTTTTSTADAKTMLTFEKYASSHTESVSV